MIQAVRCVAFTLLALGAAVGLHAQPAPAAEAAGRISTLEGWLDRFHPGAAWTDPAQVGLADKAVEVAGQMVRLTGTVDGFAVVAFTTDHRTVAGCTLEKARAFPVGDAAAEKDYVARVQQLMADLCRRYGQTLATETEPGSTTVHAVGYRSEFFGAQVFHFRGGGFRGDARVDRGSRRYFYRNVEGETPGSVSLNLGRS